METATTEATETTTEKPKAPTMDDYVSAYNDSHAARFDSETKLLGVERACKIGAADGAKEARKAFDGALRTAVARRKV